MEIKFLIDKFEIECSVKNNQTGKKIYSMLPIKSRIQTWGKEIYFNIPKNDILIENKSRNTHENALETTRFIEKQGIVSNSFLLITSAIHMRRAKACFKKEGLDCATFSTDHYYDASSTFSPNWIVPSAEAFIMWKRMIKEWVGTIMYRLFGFI